MPNSKSMPQLIPENKRMRPITRSKVYAFEEIKSANQSFVKTKPRDLFNTSHSSIV